MHDAAYLHIRARNSRATRIVSLTEASVRIGRGRSCEVRLDDPALAEVECLLRRRGNTWHLQPVEASSSLTLDGRPADGPRPVPMGSTLRLADRWLTLLPTMDGPEDEAATMVDPEGQKVIPIEPVPEPRPPADGPPDPSSDPLDRQKAEVARLEARLKQRERWLKDRLYERQWEARWRAAGASIKNRERPAGQPAEPRSRAGSAPLRPAVAPEPSLRARREPVAPAAPRYDRPVPSEPPSYPSPLARPQPTTPAASRVSPAEVEPTRSETGEPPAAEAPPESRSLRMTEPVVPVEALLESPAPEPEAAPGPDAAVLSLPAEEPTIPDAEPTPDAVLGVAEEADEPGPIEGEPAALAEPMIAEEPEAEVGDESGAVASLADREEPSGPADSVEAIDGMLEALVADRLAYQGPGTLPDEAPAIGEPDRTEAGEPGDPIASSVPLSGGPADPEPATSTELAIPWEAPGLAVAGPEEAEEAEPVERDADRPRLSVPRIGLSDLVSFLSGKAPEPGPIADPEPDVEQAPEPNAGPDPEPTAAPAPEPIEGQEPATEVRGGPAAPVAEATGIPEVEATGIEAAIRPVPEPIEDAPGPIAPDLPKPADVGEPEPEVRRSGDWPSAKAILTAQPGRKGAGSRPGARQRSVARLPLPTDRIAPDGWTVPGGSWLCIPLMFAVVAVGAVGVRLSWTWAVVDRGVGRLADRLADGKRPEGSALELLLEREQELPGAKWWNSTADQMIMRAALLAGQGGGFDPAAQERAGDLLHAASGTAPGHPSLRFAKAWRTLQDPGIDPSATALGLSRDVWTLTWTGRALLSEGKAEAAKRAYRSALEMACRARSDFSATPTFHSEPRGGRFGLPLEDVIHGIVLDMANRPEWSAEDWDDVLPDVAEVWLVAARLLRQRGDSASEAALDRAIALGEDAGPEGCSTALQLASSAEALALAGRFDEAAERYREAVDRIGLAEESARRSWMFNLAELYGRTGKPNDERSCLLESMITDPNDPVTSEAIRLQLRRGMSLVGTDGGEGDGAELSASVRPSRSRTLGE
ncbi:FHA domain-containing protein [Tautonia sp. JC769]|uniref:FHA domain-containing protein n=1 Tax=Tautonia sp. JC769 TaxID=3232135 RepID=UPI003459DB60